ncbi:hypothetical protein FHP25_27615 [Vineibacter terrae]|uniref:Uncharacterized protein n=1 Tax=Vineibacter terrae TaxID=2586908 RepID=A0A5C8PE42_9HYPH|nr:hypothetical protein [Vineibacter terrae]TXL72005.1 hypothetical protein FHP25_27615 [Vineibacter terrae]
MSRYMLVRVAYKSRDYVQEMRDLADTVVTIEGVYPEQDYRLESLQIIEYRVPADKLEAAVEHLRNAGFEVSFDEPVADDNVREDGAKQDPGGWQAARGSAASDLMRGTTRSRYLWLLSGAEASGIIPAVDNGPASKVTLQGRLSALSLNRPSARRPMGLPTCVTYSRNSGPLAWTSSLPSAYSDTVIGSSDLLVADGLLSQPS